MPLLLALLLQAAVPPTSDSLGQNPDVTVRARPPATILAEPAAMFLAGCDTDLDARTTAAERDICVERAFRTAEGAASGSIGFIAYADWAQRWLGDRNALPGPFEVDADGNNRITAAELSRRFATMFDRYDLDRDGVLSRSELVTIRAAAPGGPEGGPPNRDKRRRR
jgi:hypothetical protein